MNEYVSFHTDISCKDSENRLILICRGSVVVQVPDQLKPYSRQAVKRLPDNHPLSLTSCIFTASFSTNKHYPALDYCIKHCTRLFNPYPRCAVTEESRATNCLLRTSSALFEGADKPLARPSPTHNPDTYPHNNNNHKNNTMDTNMEDVKTEPMQLSTVPVTEPTTIPTLDGWIESLMTCKQLAESDVQRLCDKVCEYFCCAQFAEEFTDTIALAGTRGSPGRVKCAACGK
jgi:hypothetical protein